MAKLVSFLEYLTILVFSAFLFIAPYDRKLVKYILLCGVVFLFLSRLLKFKGGLKRTLFVLKPANKTVLFFLFSCFFSIALSLNPYHSQKIFTNRYLFYILLVWAGCGLGKEFGKRKIIFLIIAFNLAALFMGLGGVWDYIKRNPGSDRLWTVWGKSTPFDMLPLYISFFIPFNLAFLLNRGSKLLRGFSLINLLSLILFLIWQDCRSAFAAVTGSAVFISGFFGKKFFIRFLILLLLIFVVLTLLFSAVRINMNKYIDFNKWDNRLPLYKAAVKIFLDHPFWGAGIGMFEKLIKIPRYELPPDYFPPYKYLFIHAHSFYLETLAEMGVLGLMAFFIAFYIFFVLLVKKINSVPDNIIRPLLIGIGGLLIVSLVFGVSVTIITVGISESGISWFFFGIALGLIKREGWNG